MKKVEIRLAGTGGQGVILASIILAEAAGVYEGRYAVQTQSYGPEARGGASRADVIISDNPILYPKCRKLDLLVGLSQQAIDRYLPDLRVRGLAIIDEFYVRECSHPHTLCLPLSRTAREKLGRELFTNILTLGAIAKITGLVSINSLHQAVANRVPMQYLELNIQALKQGWDLAAGIQKTTPDFSNLT